MQSSSGVHHSYDIIGDIAITHPHGKQNKSGEGAARNIMNIHRGVKTVLAQTGAVSGDFRLRRLEYVAGERKTATCHRESGCFFLVDVERCYFSPRLSYERMRVATQVEKGDIVVNMFAGVGCFSIIIAKHADAERVYSIDMNPEAVNYMKKNVRINKVYAKVVPMLGDAKKIIEEKLRNMAARVIMPLPEKAYGYLPFALLALRKTGGWIHYYDFEYARKNFDAAEKAKLKVSERLESLGVNFHVVSSRIVRSTGPHWWQIALDLVIDGKRSELARAN